MSPRTILPWQVWWADLDPQIGREQAGVRPVIVVGTPFACELPNELAFVVPCTSTKRRLAIHPPVMLDHPSFAMCDQLKACSRQRLIRLHPTILQPNEIDGIRFVLRQLIDTS